MHRKKSHAGILPGALAALAALAIGSAAPAQPLTSSSAPSQQSSREFTNPQHRAKRTRRSAKQKPTPWRWDRNGHAVDGVGNLRSAKRLRRRVIMAISGKPNSGRQWVRVQKILRKHAPEVLTTHPRKLLAHPAARYALR